MQNPVRFYITQNDDQAVVRTIPVQPRVVVESAITCDSAVVENSTKPIDRLKATRLVKSAAKLSGSGK